MSTNDATTLIERLRELLGDAPYRYDSSLTRLVAASPYRELVGLGEDALPALADRLRAGDFFLNDAVLEITGVSRAGLVSDEFASEQEISAALVEMLNVGPIDFYSTALNVVSAVQIVAGSSVSNVSLDPPVTAPSRRKYNLRPSVDAAAR